MLVRLSVILPNRNHATLLPRALSALERQTRPADEILVIDDASTDDSRDVIRGFMPRLSNLRLLENPDRLGAVGALNRGLREATGDVVYCGASDDATDPTLFATLTGALEAHPSAALACAEARLVDEAGHLQGLRPIILPRWRTSFVSPHQTATLLRRMDNLFVSVVALYRRDLILAAGGLDERLGALCDSFLARRMALERGFVFVPRVLGTWHVQTASLSRSSALDAGRIAALTEAAVQRISQDEDRLYPQGYAALFTRRAHFASARLAVVERQFDPALIAALAQQGDPARGVLALIAGWPAAPRRVAALIWLILRLRPMSVPCLILSAAFRLLRGLVRREGHAIG